MPFYADTYVEEDYVTKGDDLILRYYVEPSKGISFEKVANMLTGESSIGTWTDIATEDPEAAKKLRPHIYLLNEKKGLIEVAYPLDLFEVTSIGGILASVAGNIYGMKALQKLRLLDIGFPEKVVKQYPGPAYGIEGIRKLTKIKERPLVGTIIKPKVGLPTKKHAKVAYDSWAGGCDVVKDDENLTDQGFNPFRDRVTETLAARDKAESETGEIKVYMANITGEVDEMFERADWVKSQGGRYLMVDVVILGYPVLQTLRKRNFGLVFHAHRAMHAALTRTKDHGITMYALAKMYRLVGMDQLHIGTVVGKMEGGEEEVKAIYRGMTQKEVERDDALGIVPQSWGDIKSTLPVSSGGLHQGHIPTLIDILGKDLVIQAGGGVHGHPDGTFAGAKALRQAVDAVMEGIPLEEKAKSCTELAGALEKFKGI
ncbi:MAG: type III ribulose-bisphosphate carboxylase [Candidatus Altiarchaeota archaeon]